MKASNGLVFFDELSFFLGILMEIVEYLMVEGLKVLTFPCFMEQSRRRYNNARDYHLSWELF
jgi:hypothetical protein